MRAAVAAPVLSASVMLLEPTQFDGRLIHICGARRSNKQLGVGDGHKLHSISVLQVYVV